MSDLLKTYISEVLNERLYWDTKKKKSEKSKKGFLDTIKGFFRGNSRLKGLVDDWSSEKELYYDIEVEDDLKQKMVEFLESKIDQVRKKVGDDEQRVTQLLRKALDVKFETTLKRLSNDSDI